MEKKTANMTQEEIVEQARQMAARRSARTPSEAPMLEMRPIGSYGDVGRRVPVEKAARTSR